MKYNFHVTAQVTGFIQRECADDEEAERIKDELEGDETFTVDEFIPGVEVEVEDVEVLNFGEN